MKAANQGLKADVVLEGGGVRDPSLLDRIPLAGQGLALLQGTGIYQGDYAHDWVRSQLAALNVHTFRDLKIADESLPPERRYKLVVTAPDVTLGQLVRLPWDYKSVYGLDPDEMPVADAVRASMSIPFFFRPVTLANPTTKATSTLVDGGLSSNFPIDSLDRADGRKPCWPTFGVTVLPNLPAGDDKVIPLLALPLPGGTPSAGGSDRHHAGRPGPGVPQPALCQCAHHSRRLDPGRRSGLRDHGRRNPGVVSERLPGREGFPVDVGLAGIRPTLPPGDRHAGGMIRRRD
jgi:predicted acylesterase/phospholipase RssA